MYVLLTYTHACKQTHTTDARTPFTNYCNISK